MKPFKQTVYLNDTINYTPTLTKLGCSLPWTHLFLQRINCDKSMLLSNSLFLSPVHRMKLKFALGFESHKLNHKIIILKLYF